MSKHTPGPWHCGASNGIHTANGMPYIAQVNHERSEADANALLIAAAPDMLAALIAAEYLAFEVGSETEDGFATILEDSRGDLWRQISAALQKAGVNTENRLT